VFTRPVRYRTAPTVAATLALMAGLALAAGLAGCGFVRAAGVSHTKPSGFVLRGRVTVPVGTGDSRPDGAACAANTADIVAGAPVRVADPGGHPLGTGALGPGVIAHTGSKGSCEFPFQVSNVAGGVDSYILVVGNRPPRSFPAKDLRQDQPAVINITE
jgi:hypothetical protein